MTRFDRFTRKARTTRGSIPKAMRQQVFDRDDYTCQFCGLKKARDELTIDHLIPLAEDGLDDVTNYVSACRPCNERKADTPLAEFAESINIRIEDLPVHGDPIINNKALPIQIRLLRKRIFDRVRHGELRTAGKSAQKKLEKEYRLEFWGTPLGQLLEAEFPSLPGHVRVMIPEIRAISKTPAEFLLLLELAKSANTRNLIGSLLVADSDVIGVTRRRAERTQDQPLRKRLQQAWARFQRECRKHGLAPYA